MSAVMSISPRLSVLAVCSERQLQAVELIESLDADAIMSIIAETDMPRIIVRSESLPALKDVLFSPTLSKVSHLPFRVETIWRAALMQGGQKIATVVWGGK